MDRPRAQSQALAQATTPFRGSVPVWARGLGRESGPDPVLEQQARQLGASYLIQDGDPSTLVALLADGVSASSLIDASSD